MGLWFPLFFATSVFALWLGAMVFWVLKIIEGARIPDQQFRAPGSEKVTWILVVALAGIVGALIWHFAKRDDVLRAGAYSPVSPPGWYPSPQGAGFRWWG